MNEKRLILYIGDKIEIAAALVRTANIAAQSKEVFLEDGQAIAVTLEIAGTELRRCHNMAEHFLKKKSQEIKDSADQSLCT